MTGAEFRRHAAHLRKHGATRVRYATKTVEMECEFAAVEIEVIEPQQHQAAIGFQVHGEDDETCEDDE